MFHALAGRGRLLLLVPVPSFQPLIRARGTKSGGDLRTSSGTAAKRAAAPLSSVSSNRLTASSSAKRKRPGCLQHEE
uniref:Cytomegalovirus DNA for mtrIII region n=1 Tax=Human cytomegalovirus TaxID=10359 RepID=Q68828_HCMV|nr:unnamed protein product [Human betaherpesvirus 5]